jgi:hypothetical protein
VSAVSVSRVGSLHSAAKNFASVEFAIRKYSQEFNTIFMENYSPACPSRTEECIETSKNSRREECKWRKWLVHEASRLQKAYCNDYAEWSEANSFFVAPGASICQVETRILIQTHEG